MSTTVDETKPAPVRPATSGALMEPSQARAFLIAQHDGLRQLLAELQRAADRVLAGETVVAELTGQLDVVRVAFAAHNANEEAMLEPILRIDFAWGPARIARMLEEHGAEHASLHAALAGADLEVAGRVTELIEDIDAHMAAEERTFLSASVLRDLTA